MFSEGKKPTKLPRKSSPELFSKLRGFKKKKSLISCLSGCVICKFCFKDSMPQKCINAWNIVLKIFIVGWRVTRLMSTGNLLKLLCVVQDAKFFREKKWPLSAYISGNVSCCQEVNLHLFTHLFLLPWWEVLMGPRQLALANMGTENPFFDCAANSSGN